MNRQQGSAALGSQFLRRADDFTLIGAERLVGMCKPLTQETAVGIDPGNVLLPVIVVQQGERLNGDGLFPGFLRNNPLTVPDGENALLIYE